MNPCKILLIKVGGSLLQDEALIVSLCSDVKKLQAIGFKVILVHGGGKAINAALNRYSITAEFIDGLRVTSAAAMQVIEMVLCGQINSLIVRKLNSLGVDAIGLSGADQNLLQCDYYSNRHGQVGKITRVNPAAIQRVLKTNPGDTQQVIPVIATVGVGEDGTSFNINADLAASYIAEALSVDQLIYLTDQEGIYNKEGQLYTQRFAGELEQLITHSVVTEGMLVKVKAILNALKAGLNHIMVLNGRRNHILIDALIHQKKAGTLCQNRVTSDVRLFAGGLP